MREIIYDVTALGELLVDFTEGPLSSHGNPTFEANPGGAPCNVLSMLSRLGHRTAFIGKVGRDAFGEMLREKAQAQGINMSGLVTDRKVHTTLAFVQKLPNGDRDFSFYRNPGADVMLRPEEVRAHRGLIENAAIFHFGTLSMTDEIAERATLEAVSIAKDNGVLVSFDPNYRPPLWNSQEQARDKMIFGMRNTDIMKISDNEITFLTGEEDVDKGVRRLIDRYEIPLVFATLGPAGSRAYYRGQCVAHDGFRNPDTIETTGAGDTFCACALHFVLQYGIRNLNPEILTELLEFANAAASLITTRRGALAVMPTQAEILDYMKTFSP